MLAGLIENRVSTSERAELELHAVACSACLDVMAATLPSAVVGVPVDQPSDLPSRVEAAVPRVRGGSRLRRWAIAAAVLIAVGGALLGVLHQPITHRATAMLARLGSTLLGVPLQVGSVDVGFGDDPSTFVITLNQVTIGRDPKRLVSVDEIGVAVALAAPLRGESLITTVRATRLVLNLVGGAPGETFVSEVERGKALALLMTASRIAIVDARVVLPVPGDVPLAADALDGGMERTEQGVRLVLHGRAAGGVIDVAGNLAGDGHRVALTIGGRGLDAAALPILAGRVKGLVDLRFDVMDVGDARRRDGRVAVRDGRVVGGSPLALLLGSAASRDVLTELYPAFAGDDLRFEDARAIFSWRGETWRFPRIFVATQDVIAGGGARITAKGEVVGHGTLRIPAEMVAALQPHEPRIAAFRAGDGAAILPFVVGGPLEAPQFTLDRP
jgi:hypothetical protein